MYTEGQLYIIVTCINVCSSSQLRDRCRAQTIGNQAVIFIVDQSLAGMWHMDLLILYPWIKENYPPIMGTAAQVLAQTYRGLALWNLLLRKVKHLFSAGRLIPRKEQAENLGRRVAEKVGVFLNGSASTWKHEEKSESPLQPTSPPGHFVSMWTRESLHRQKRSRKIETKQVKDTKSL
jgi:hypothetical protein